MYSCKLFTFVSLNNAIRIRMQPKLHLKSQNKYTNVLYLTFLFYLPKELEPILMIDGNLIKYLGLQWIYARWNWMTTVVEQVPKSTLYHEQLKINEKYNFII